MNHLDQWPFVIAAWALTLGVSAVLSLWSWRAMRTAEKGSRRP